MATILSSTDREATIRLENGETCGVSVRYGGVRVRRSLLGLFNGPILFSECNSSNVTRIGLALNARFPDRSLPSSLGDSNLDAFVNAVMQCPSSDEIRTVFQQISQLSDGAWPPPLWWQPKTAEAAVSL
jgi:hypothetical protein